MFWRGKKVFLTGHTGFKGGWLSLWLQMLGAEVTGYALEPPTSPNLFEAASVASCMRSNMGDVCDLPRLKHAMADVSPEIVFHLAAQPLVRVSYQEPILTYKTNVIGTASLLEAARQTASVKAVLVITSDKCYENREWDWGYREIDTLGGHDPYSSSKACAELVVSAYRSSFFRSPEPNGRTIAVATARAGNVIGGGDWAQFRLIPDIVRSFSQGNVLKIRNPQAVRPWQHVLDPLHGYLMLAQKLYEEGPSFASAWNFGPNISNLQPVRWIVEKTASMWGPTARWEIDQGEQPHEDRTLQLDWSKAAQQLGWRPQLSLEDALAMSIDWYRHFLSGKSASEKCGAQISGYCSKVGCKIESTTVA